MLRITRKLKLNWTDVSRSIYESHKILRVRIYLLFYCHFFEIDHCCFTIKWLAIDCKVITKVMLIIWVKITHYKIKLTFYCQVSKEMTFLWKRLLLKRQPCKMVKHTQTICRLLPTNCLSVFDHFVGLALIGLKVIKHILVLYRQNLWNHLWKTSRLGAKSTKKFSKSISLWLYVWVCDKKGTFKIQIFDLLKYYPSRKPLSVT